jgi:hypothetical protein
LWIGALAAAAFLAQALAKRTWRSARTAAQTIGAAGLTSLAPAAWYVVTGGLGRQAWALWIANFLFACNQIHYVHLRIQAARVTDRREKLSAGRGFLAGQAALALILAAACAVHLFRWAAAAAFLPLLVRGFSWFAAPSQPLAICTLGKRELLHAIVFAILLVLGFQ